MSMSCWVLEWLSRAGPTWLGTLRKKVTGDLANATRKPPPKDLNTKDCKRHEVILILSLKPYCPSCLRSLEIVMSEDAKILEDIGQYKYGFHDRDDNYTFKSQKGLSREVVENISRMKGEPEWMLEFRLKALDHFLQRPMPNWGPSLKELNFDEIYFYVKPTEKSEKSWDDVPDDIKRTFDKLGVPEAERKFLAGLGAQYESEMVYHSIQEHLEKQGVIFMSIEDGLKNYPDMFREYFGTVIPIEDNKFAALNSAVWSGGSFVYVPKGVKVDMPLQAYFRLNTANLGQFERTLIIVDEGASVHYVEGCTAPQYTTDSFHSGVIEIIVKKGARSRYSTIQ